jgi:hypothetical protein
MEKIEVTQQEIWAATRRCIHKNKKKYSRKGKSGNRVDITKVDNN